MRAEGSILKDVRETGDLTDETAAKLEQELKRFQQAFNVQEEVALVS